MWIMDWERPSNFLGQWENKIQQQKEVGGQSGERLGLSIPTGEGFPPSIFFEGDLLAFLRCLSPAYQTLGPRHAVVKNGRWHACNFFADDQRRLLDDSVVDTHHLDGFSYNVICSFSTLSKSLEFWKQHVSSNSPQLGYFSWKIYKLGCLGYRIMAVQPSSIYTIGSYNSE